eukprot:250028-Chlamydomonas_euryale.AAC.1
MRVRLEEARLDLLRTPRDFPAPTQSAHLCRNRPNALPRMRVRLEEARLDLSQQPVKRLGRQLAVANEALGRELRAQIAEEHDGRVALRLS